jgi:hypothetical protein
MQIMDWNLINIVDDTSGTTWKRWSTDILIQRLLQRLYTVFEPDKLSSMDYVIIESQSHKNPKMKAIAVALFTFFSMTVRNSNSTVVKTVSAKSKLIPKQSSYTQRKKTAIHYASEYVPIICRSNPALGVMFQTSDKKDDLADCLLQALSFCGASKASEIVDVQGTQGSSSDISLSVSEKS